MQYDHDITHFLQSKKLICINGKYYLTNEQIEVLKKYQIPYEQCASINEIVFYIEEILNTDCADCEDLEMISASLAEVDYYQNYRK